MLSDNEIDVALNKLDIEICQTSDKLNEMKYNKQVGPKMMDFVVDGKFIKPTVGTRKNKVLEIVKKGQHLKELRMSIKQLEDGPMQTHCVEKAAVHLLFELGIEYDGN